MNKDGYADLVIGPFEASPSGRAQAGTSHADDSNDKHDDNDLNNSTLQHRNWSIECYVL